MLSNVVLEKNIESPLDSKEIKLVNPKGNQPWIFIGRVDAEAEAPILWIPESKSQLIGRDSDTGKDWRQKEKRVREDEMVGWHHWFNAHELGKILGDGERLRNLACYVYVISKSQTWLGNWTIAKAIYREGGQHKFLQWTEYLSYIKHCAWQLNRSRKGITE